jgi:hypothetical protein
MHLDLGFLSCPERMKAPSKLSIPCCFNLLGVPAKRLTQRCLTNLKDLIWPACWESRPFDDTDLNTFAVLWIENQDQPNEYAR